jgi:small-conductance mechanosensitive channel
MAVEINGIKGTVLEVSQTYIVLDTDAGKVLVPGYMANEYAITIAAITPGRSD